MSVRRRAALVILGAFLGGGAAAAAEVAVPAFAPLGTAAPATIRDGATLTLADGRVLRLAGIAPPPPAVLRGKPAAEATAALAALVAGQALELRSAGNASDRRGRVVAQLFAGGRWVQGELLRRGLVRVAGSADDRAGLAAMLALEDAARQARRGLWRLEFFAVRRAEDAARDAGSFQIVEGTVADVVLVEGGAYVDFGADWRNSFALRIGRDALRLCRAAGLDPLRLKGARLRVRGFIDGTRRPLIDVTFPEQIEQVPPLARRASDQPGH